MRRHARYRYRMNKKAGDGLISLSGDWGSISVHELGATVTSWRPGGREALFTASDETPGAAPMWHGGIPVCAPWFGAGPGDWKVPFSHGLVSRVRWKVISTASDDDRAHLTLATDAAATRDLPGANHFPSDLRYVLDIVADASRLTLGLTIVSPTRDAVVELAFHPYLLTDAPTASVAGLESVGFTDYAVSAVGSEDSPVAVGRYLDRVYEQARPTKVTSQSGSLRLAAQGASSVIVWNPGPAGTQVPDGEWERFVCVEYGCVKRNQTLIPAGGTHLLRMTITVD